MTIALSGVLVILVLLHVHVKRYAARHERKTKI